MNVDTLPWRTISVCAGVGGFERGLRLAFRNAVTACFVEREITACEVLAARIADGVLDDAPVWLDVRTFDGRPWRGRVDCVTASIPCQGYSVAGRRNLEQDPRDLWADTRRILREVGCEWFALENVAGILVPERKRGLSAGVARIVGELAEDGFDAEWIMLGSGDCAGSHKRERFWLLARRRRDVADVPNGRSEQEQSRGHHQPQRASEGAERSGSGAGGGRDERHAAGGVEIGGRIAASVARPVGDGDRARQDAHSEAGASRRAVGESGGGVPSLAVGVAVGDSDCEGWKGRGVPGCGRADERSAGASGGAGIDVADGDGDGRLRSGLRLSVGRSQQTVPDAGRSSAGRSVDDADGEGEPRLSVRAGEFLARSGVADVDDARGVGLADAAGIGEREPHDAERADARCHARQDVGGRGVRSVADAADTARRRQGEGRREGRREVVAGSGGITPGDGLPLSPPGPRDADAWRRIVAERPDLAPAIEAATESSVRGMADEMAARMDVANADRQARLRMLGNGIDPVVAATALLILYQRLTEATA